MDGVNYSLDFFREYIMAGILERLLTLVSDWLTLEF